MRCAALRRGPARLGCCWPSIARPMDRVHARAERRERVPCQMKTQHSKELAKIEQSILVNTRSPYIVQMFFSFQSKRERPHARHALAHEGTAQHSRDLRGPGGRGGGGA